jgi:hypothetical protein
MAVIPNLRSPDQYLTNFSFTMARDSSQFKAANTLPSVNVQNQSGIYRTFSSDALREVRVRPYASGTQTSAGKFEYGEGQYNARLYGLHVDLDPITMHNAASTTINIERDTTSYLTTQMLLERENRFYNTFMKDGVWGVDKTGTDAGAAADEFVQFDDASSDPVSTIQDAMLSVQLSSGGFMPNTIYTGRRVFNALLRHPEILDRIRFRGGDSPAVANEQTLASVFGVSSVVVFDTVVQGADGESAMLGDNTMLLAYVENTAGLNSPTAMARFNWVGPNNYLTLGGSVIKMNHPLLDGTVRLEMKYADDMRVVAPVLGCFFKNVLGG